MRSIAKYKKAVKQSSVTDSFTTYLILSPTICERDVSFVSTQLPQN